MTRTRKQHATRFHSFYMRWEVITPRGKVVAMYVSEDAAIEHAFRLNYPTTERNT